MNPQTPNYQQALQQQNQPQQSVSQAIPSAAQQLQLQAQQTQMQQGQNMQNMSMDKQGAALDIQKLQQKATMSKALAQINPNANSGNSALDTASKVGQAMGDGSSGWANLCEAFAEKQIYGKTGMYPTAYAAYQANAQAGNIKTSASNIPTGAQVFMAPDASNGNNGHTGVMQKNGQFLAPLSNGSIEEFTIPEWEKFSGQRFIGWASPQK